MTELKDFLYELHRYAMQTHILKDKYEKLSEGEKTLVMQQAPIDQPTPENHYKYVFDWLDAMQNELGVNNKE